MLLAKGQHIECDSLFLSDVVGNDFRYRADKPPPNRYHTLLLQSWYIQYTISFFSTCWFLVELSPEIEE